MILPPRQYPLAPDFYRIPRWAALSAWLFLAALFALAMLACSGCTPDAPAKMGASIAAGQVAIGGLGANLATTASEADAIAKADPQNPTVLAHVSTIQTVTKASVAELAPLNQELSDAAGFVKAYQHQTAQLKAEQAQFWSDRQRAIFWWAVGIIAGLAVLWVVLDFATGLGAPISAFAKVAFAVVTLGFKDVTGAIGRFNDWLAAKIRKVPVAVVTAQGVAPAQKSAVLATASQSSVAPAAPV